ncbi:MAG: 50S ribosomal protein L21e [Candidatus Lokiarchaeota archaeon]|nr:50S ribosomal protein L21e [Candidatus Lokiarchaeota archaeon]
MKKSHGFKSRHTRFRLRKRRVRDRGLAPLGRFLQEYTVGDMVDIIIDPSIHKAQPHYRFHGRTGKIIDTRGQAYLIKIKDGNKEKTLITRKEHMRLSKSTINKVQN